jgi:hypothetical protein
MKTQDLRIGNLLTNFKNETEKVSGLDLKIWSNTEIPEQIKPIQLTEEWLIKFGFEWKNHGLRLDIFCIRQEINGYVIYLSNESHNFKIDIKHVHQLQNLYFELTGSELEFAG